jgi:hypothetical protein
MSVFRIGSEFAVNQVTNLSQTGVRVASLPNGRYIVVWSSDANTPNEADIIGRIFNADGSPAGAEFAVSSQNVGHQATPDVVALTNGNFVVTWVDYNATQDGDSTSIKAQVFDGNGVPVGSEFLVNVSGVGRQDSAEVAALSNGGFVITWDDWPTTDMFGRIYGADGQATSGAIRMNSGTTGWQELGEVIGLANGNFLAMWRTTDTAADGSGDAIKARIFDPSGNAVGVEFRINTLANGSQNAPAVTVLANGNFVVTWVTSDTTQDGSSSAIKAQVFDASGNKVGLEFLVNSQGVNLQNSPTITALVDGGFFVSWFTNDAAQDGNLGAVKGRFFDAFGVPVGAEFLINTVTIGSQSQPSVAANADGSVMVTWVSSIDGFTDRNIRGQIFRVNDAPTINSDGGNSSAAISMGENASAVTTVVAADGFSPQPLTYSITGGADAALFTINGSTGALEFIVAPDFEAPTDNDGNNVYEVIVRVTDGDLSDSQAIAITVANVNEAPIITSNNGEESAALTVSENGGAVATVTATDIDSVSLSYAIVGGVDAALFAIDPVTGVLNFVGVPDFEAPIDADANNIYELLVAASDGSLIDTQSLLISIADVNEAPEILSGGGGSDAAYAIAEGDIDIATILASDPEGNPRSYSIIGGVDAARFAIDAVTGVLSFINAPNFEAPTDADGNNIYEVIVQASDGTLVDSQTLSVTVTNQNETPTITSNGGGASAAVALNENSLAVTTVQSIDPDGNPSSYSIVGGVDAARFAIDAVTGVLSFINAPNFEAPTDVGGNNVYNVIVQASDGVLVDTQALAVTVANVNEAPIITSNGGGTTASILSQENSRFLGSMTATDAEGATLTYSIAGGADAALFTINASTGMLLFVTAPDYETPLDAGANNVYDVVLQVSDGVNVTTQAVAVTVGNAFDGITLNGGNGSNVLTGTTGEDWIDGRGGADTITGGRGADRLTGGSGADRFVYTSVADSLLNQMDIITDFSRSQGDRISLSGIDANANIAGDQAFSFIGTAAFSNVAGQLRYQQVGGNTFLYGDVNGDGVADFGIQLSGNVALQAIDFTL